MNRAVRLWPCKCQEVIGLHGFLFVEFDTRYALRRGLKYSVKMMIARI